MGLFSFLSKNTQPQESRMPFKVDMHSHLIHDVDDGVKTLNESLDVMQGLMELGYEHFITTPHIMTDFYKNSKDTLLPKRDEIREELEKRGVKVSFDVAAEYYLDDGFSDKLNDRDNLLTINNEYLLVETSYLNAPHNLYSIIFDIQLAGLKPILAHPERYTYMYDSFEKYEEVFEKGVLFQINLNSLSGYYSKPAKDIVEKLIDRQMVHFAGTDCHSQKQVDALQKAMQTKGFAKMKNLTLHNDNLL